MSQFSLLNVVDGQVLLQKCTACALADRTDLVTNCMSGTGPQPATLMFVGKAPAKEDDKIGEPMTGKNGKLFHELLEEARIDPLSIYISNCLKCAPRKGETLKTKYWMACKAHLKVEIARVKPQAIIAVGAEALNWLAGVSGGSRLRKVALPCVLSEDIPVYPLGQPAQLFHSEGAARTRLRNILVEDLEWLRDRAEEGNLGRSGDMELDYKIAFTLQDVNDFLVELEAEDDLCCDLETFKRDFGEGQLFPTKGGCIAAIGFSKGPGHARAIPLFAQGSATLHWWTDEEYTVIHKAIGELLQRKRIFGQNFVQFDQKWIWHEWGIQRLNLSFDTQYAAYLHNEQPPHGLEFLASVHTSMPPWKKTFQGRDTEKLCEYLCKDVDATFRIRNVLLEQLTPKQLWLLTNLLIPVGHVLMEMEYKGVVLDMTYLEEVKDYLEKRIHEIMSDLRKMEEVRAFEFDQNTEVNINNPKHIAEIMEHYFNLEAVERTGTGAYSTNARVLEHYATHPFIQAVQQHRGLAKLRGTYVEGLEARLDAGNRLHTNYKLHGTVTGRPASEDPNLMTLPREDTAGKVLDDAQMIKKMFSCQEGYCLLHADYSQAELRTLAMNSLDDRLVWAYQQGMDIHSSTAADVYGVELADVTKEQRQAAKTVNFGIIYGRSMDSIGEQFVASYLKAWEKGDFSHGRTKEQVTAKARKDAKEFWDGHHESYPVVWRWMDLQEEIIREHGFQETHFGRRRHYGYVDNHAIRQAYNNPIQSEASDFTMFALARVDAVVKEMKYDARAYLTVYDSIIYEVKLEQLWDVAGIMKYVMENLNFGFMNVPLVADFEAGLSWGKLKPIDIENRKVLGD